ncbi:1-acyl-sn-glycerol-3-phosphate acyltransferase [Leptospira sp. 2 VSF19]|uniref:1-acyl-sn-glycerol-3-phosphate acyltransferase n=1 Tax=Leptospira soteropolitanensis TaxID=2950025 RepID=A0AAW5VGL6_9LEPT|nr:1-acyl-sn-glycerol-3-phosphate acyltransferase [Leptospira soteropolitanensis]MCW7491143.1 1-acyl-sn-glycerol-3-phosphate acyltransferase [Leptospira soteropolitanensis]MCW7498727.1 1-acyl-sn-glycerol-3-phosphate acyltransferase [Leptospira soteropolitanensis]MCW7521680.1 1-acyl-sn-glycerol-3-phosphate acyltransferase [Leptospira soteropolitanensis]MCW7524831.1 1-acyl-sn-glycerol-3-phosphate acyltransferase [Leptospira soteropolitanensis]MCW7528698.1 1-acyl-sn-glycerol-3-phosphate acyltrans
MFYYVGRSIGFMLMWIVVKPMRLKYGNKKVEIQNDHVLRKLNGKSIIFISNHIKPRNKFLKVITMPYDAFVIRGVLKRYGIYTTALTSYDSGIPNKGKKRKWLYRKEQMVKGIVKSIDLIPLNRSESDPVTIKDFKRRIGRGNLGIGIFPEGSWYRGFRKSRKLYPGMVVLSKRYNLPIVPLYLDAYNMNKPIRMSVGNPIWEVTDAPETINYIRSELIRLKDKGTSILVTNEAEKILDDENDGLEISPSVS